MTMFDKREIEVLVNALSTLEKGFESLPEFDPGHDYAAMQDVLERVAKRMQQNYPYHHPRYAGQMLKPPHPVARLAYALSLWVNPNNHALDGGRASSVMEKECIAAIGTMFGLDDPLGHLCGGGTMANLEALWVAGRKRPGKTILASSQAHYTHSRISDVLGLSFESVPVTGDGRMDTEALERRLECGDIGAVVATLGTTGLGAVDPLPRIVELRQRYDFRIHVDAAYGGYFTVADELDDNARAAFDSIAAADSLVIDPHKHGLQPYGCGCVLFPDRATGALYKHDSPYTYFSSAELHLGEISLECSRPGAAAVALWATQQLLPMAPGGTFASDLDKSLLAARELWTRLKAGRRFHPLMRPELDIVVFAMDAADARKASDRARRLFDAAAQQDLHLALIDVPVSIVSEFWPDLDANRESVTCLRSCLMKPGHLAWMDDIWSTLEAVASGLDD